MSAFSHSRRVGLLVFLVLAAGCVTPCCLVPTQDRPPTGQVSQIAFTWDKTITLVPDCVNGGKANPGLLGRLYLFGPDGKYPLAGDGTMHVELYDDSPLASGGQAVLKAKWDFDKDTLKGCLHKDIVGWGYTFFLPWEMYSPDIKKVHLMMCYAPPKGLPFYKQSQTMVLREPDGGMPATAIQTTQPGQPMARLAPPSAQQTAVRQ